MVANLYSGYTNIDGLFCVGHVGDRDPDESYGYYHPRFYGKYDMKFDDVAVQTGKKIAGENLANVIPSEDSTPIGVALIKSTGSRGQSIPHLPTLSKRKSYISLENPELISQIKNNLLDLIGMRREHDIFPLTHPWKVKFFVQGSVHNIILECACFMCLIITLHMF